jgi:hypothetical protein
MPREDLRLPVERCVVAVFADQHLREQSRRCQPARDRMLRRRCLGDAAARPARIFGACDPHHPQLCRHPVEHLADALADCVKRIAASRAGIVCDVEQQLVTGQVIGQRLAVRRSVHAHRRDRFVLDHRRNVGFQIIKAERKLVVIEPLGTPPELHSLELFDDRLKPFDLVIAGRYDADDITHQLVQDRRLMGQIVEIEPHDRSYTKTVRSTRIIGRFPPFMDSLYSARLGLQTLLGWRQSIPSSSIANCAGDSGIDTPGPRIRGQVKWPSSMRLTNRHKPVPSQ